MGKVRMSVVAVVGWALAGVAMAQDPAAGADPAEGAPAEGAADPAPPPPSLEESLTFLKELLTNNPSDRRPCLASSAIELGEQGVLLITTTRQSYCPDTQLRVHVQDLDDGSAAISVTDRGRVTVRCMGDDPCVRRYHKRKERVDDAWTLRDQDWRAGGELDREHRTGTATVLVGADTRTATLAKSSLSYVIRSARRDARYAEPNDPFEGRVAQAGPAEQP